MNGRATNKDLPPLLVEVAIEPKTKADQVKLRAVLASLMRDDPAFDAVTDPESGQTILKSTSLEEIETKFAALMDQHHVGVIIGAPQVAYREALSKSVSITYTHSKVTGGSGQFAEVSIDFEPLPPHSGFVFGSAIAGGSIPKEFIPAVEKGLRAQKESGLLAGFPVIDFKATLTEGKYHEMDSTELTFDIAARAAFRELAKNGAVKLLEPIMLVEVMTLDDFTGGVMGDLLGRRGVIITQNELGYPQIAITATVPLANMFYYDLCLKSMTGGQGKFTMAFDRYDVVPPSIVDGDDPKFPGAAALRVA